ncbi:helix-turn-helix domain-containing protein [Kibdelosporangium philippinense]|uniref:Helix-turn-helix domain-containing protein n=2 Tax=Kibdelosporangium philippinense TaxID=211113 RepID=A0ABS8ZU47_9PSEU|nr:helix-turn-helix transcriptional regulator [Kibdelosporangium philippinense]MCE7009948.1 helix-turn-helix domain-containing protein [Kibdelosporangium philippinense]
MSIVMWGSTSEPGRPPFLRSRLGVKLRRMREAANLTLDEAASRLDKTRSALHRIETGETKQNIHLVRSMMDVYDCPDATLIDEVRKALKRPWHHAYGAQNRYHVDAETEAAVVCDFSTLVVPELLQTEEYTLALLKDWDHPAPFDEVIVRRIRQQRLTAGKPSLRLIAVIDEMVLRRIVGGSETMRDQLQRLIDAAAIRTVALHVLPTAGQSPCTAMGPFTLMMLSDSADPDLLHIDQLAGPLDLEDSQKLADAHDVFKHLRSQALGEAASIQLIERVLTENHRPSAVSTDAEPAPSSSHGDSADTASLRYSPATGTSEKP